jgi:glyoxylase-like metal-dependent hydrolase (beta-lactamase superfamily II)
MSTSGTSGDLGYETFVLEPAPQSFSEPLPNGGPHVFQPLAVTLIYGENDAVLVDPPMTIEQASIIGDWIAAHGKRLTHMLISHGHADHWLTADLLNQRFGGQVQVVATDATIAQMQGQLQFRDAFWGALFPGDQIPDSPITAVCVPDNRITLEGHEIRLIEVGHTDGDDTSVIHVADLGLVVGGDVLYNGVHMYIGESSNGGADAWRRALDIVQGLNARWIVASHKDKDRDDDATRVLAETRGYLDDAEQALAKYGTKTEFFHGMIERHPDYRYGQTVLWVSAKSLYNLRELGGDPGEHTFKAWITP